MKQDLKRLTVRETAKLTGISVRTLHYYDEIGLLKPTVKTEAGYRYYDKEALAVLQEILLYRELDFSLKEIKEILSMPDYDRKKALKAHKELLILKQKRLSGLIKLVDETMKGDHNVSFKEFKMDEINEAKEKYGKEARERWGATEAYKVSEKKTSAYGEKDWERIAVETSEIFSGFAACVQDNEKPDSPRAMDLVEQWKALITKYYYPCTDEILAGLGEMYVADGRFMENIDRSGSGTAAFMSQAIKACCSK
jgi:DNA-binding transcriptional MerR regulator